MFQEHCLNQHYKVNNIWKLCVNFEHSNFYVAFKIFHKRKKMRFDYGASLPPARCRGPRSVTARTPAFSLLCPNRKSASPSERSSLQMDPYSLASSSIVTADERASIEAPSSVSMLSVSIGKTNSDPITRPPHLPKGHEPMRSSGDPA